jgi:glycosyltransferase involved in cell wall biosynthesis
MISVLTLTYKRHRILEEAICSFLMQKVDCPVEMVVVNDHPAVKYYLNADNVNILNKSTRYPSIASKLEAGALQCKYNFIYRLDDDDLLAEGGLQRVYEDIMENPGYEIYRSRGHYLFVDNMFEDIHDNINNGNVYTKDYLKRIPFPDKSGDEDVDITFGNNAKIYKSTKVPTMIYRWGMNTMHISGLGKQPNDVVLNRTDMMLKDEKGDIMLQPNFKNDYYGQINPNSKLAGNG